jgi:hypothetical protein
MRTPKEKETQNNKTNKQTDPHNANLKPDQPKQPDNKKNGTPHQPEKLKPPRKLKQKSDTE